MAEETQAELFKELMAPPPAPEQPQPAAPEPRPEVQAPPVTEPTPATPAPPTPTPTEGIPAWRLREEMDARREAEARLRQLEEQFQRNQATAPDPKQTSFFDNPDQAATRIIAQQLQPFVEYTQRQMIAMGKMLADNVYGADVVSKAEEAFMEARNNRSLDPVDYERVVQSPNRYAECVQWYNNRQVVTTVGNDPMAWFEKQLEARLADPKFQATVLQKMQGSAKPGTPAVQLPPSLSKVTASKSNGGGNEDASDASLWAFATGKNQ